MIFILMDRSLVRDVWVKNDDNPTVVVMQDGAHCISFDAQDISEMPDYLIEELNEQEELLEINGGKL